MKYFYANAIIEEPYQEVTQEQLKTLLETTTDLEPIVLVEIKENKMYFIKTLYEC